MALGKAIKFVKEAVSDSDLRSVCALVGNKEELLNILGFDMGEFDDAINMQLVKCQSYEQAEHYQQIKMWFLLL